MLDRKPGSGIGTNRDADHGRVPAVGKQTLVESGAWQTPDPTLEAEAVDGSDGASPAAPHDGAPSGTGGPPRSPTAAGPKPHAPPRPSLTNLFGRRPAADGAPRADAGAAQVAGATPGAGPVQGVPIGEWRRMPDGSVKRVFPP